jgi:hypothetical protein
LALACDLRVAAGTAFFALPEAAAAARTASVVLPQVVPSAIALEWLFTRRRVPVQEAGSEAAQSRHCRTPADGCPYGWPPRSFHRRRYVAENEDDRAATAGMPLHAGLRMDVGEPL